MNPQKYLNKDLKNKTVPFDVWLQGIVERTTNEYIIISDSTGQAKVSINDMNEVNIGNYCCVIGVTVNTDDIPEIKAAKLIKISPNHQQSWELEVQEAQMILQGLIAPKL